MAKAKKEGLKMKRLPLDRYLQWTAGSGKSLTLNQMVTIMNDMKFTGNWEYALRHVPRRKIIEHADSIKNDRNSLTFDKSHKRPVRIFKQDNDFGYQKVKVERKMKRSSYLSSNYK